MALTENCRIYQAPKDSGSTQTSDVIELNVGGQVYYTRRATLTSMPSSLLAKMFSSKKETSGDMARDTRGRCFIDRDGFLFRYVLDYLRDKYVVLPDHFPERGRLKREAEYFQLPELVKILSPDDLKRPNHDEYPHSDVDDISQGSDQRPYPSSHRRYGFITVASTRDACASDGKGTRLPKLFVCGRVALAKEVFGEALRESRDPERPPERYTSRFVLTFGHAERAFDLLAESGFRLVACSSALTSPLHTTHIDHRQWCKCTEYVFFRGPSAWSSSHCECCCKSQKSEREGESGTSFNELSTSCSETQSEASSPQETVIARPVSQQHHHIQTLERTQKKGPAQAMQGETHRRTELLRTRTTGPRDHMTPSKRKPTKEKLTPEQELQKCIQDFRRIRIPERFPDRKNTWQSDLLRKYRL
ncbi:BTB/POZ domain-containing protein KCTD16a [Tachysurus fulvidraco]|uniref:BTB/POZ domain-containing protein KCTD16a n=1 Tax=Tachysurus fulvidraco TaxID=1234273 RepID=UPI001FED6698|nr:BTB/POZ domain-containing protein KCTD16a [Tachysurus fulvidraco]